MPKNKSTVPDVVTSTLDKITKVSLPKRKFIFHIFELWISMNCRYVFTNMERWGEWAEKTYRNWFSKSFDWFDFNSKLTLQSASKEIIAVFDPSYIKKSGKHTYGTGYFWSGVRQCALRGLEIGCLAFVDVINGTALHALARQTPGSQELKEGGKTLTDHYRSIIAEKITEILAITQYLAVDGYFMKKDFILPLVDQGLHIITKARSDANLNYLYKGKQSTGKGRKKLYDGKVDIGNIDKRRLPKIYEDDKVKIYGGCVYCVQLKRIVLAAFLYYPGKNTPEIIIGTDYNMEVMTLCKYYGLRFQIEFLIRDAKQHSGLEDCMARDQEKLHNHFNISLTMVSLAKSAHHLSIPKDERGSFSMADIKMYYMNRLITNRIFSNLQIDLTCKKIKRIYAECLNFGRLRA
jgi:hypothetical protein